MRIVTTFCTVCFFCLFQSVHVMGSSENSTYTALANEVFGQEQKIKKLTTHEFRKLLTSKKFDEMEEVLNQLSEGYKSNIRYEYPWLFSYISLEEIGNRIGSDEAYRHYFNEWVDEKQSATAYAARGFFLFGIAVAHRGTNFISETKRAQLKKMNDYFVLMHADFSTALAKDPGILPIYERLMHAAMLQGNDALVEQTGDRALDIAPRSYWIRAKFLQHLEPRWGGSYNKMTDYINTLVPIYDLNPRLWQLKGAPDADQALRFAKNRKLQDALHSIDKALAYGDKFVWLQQKAEYAYELGNYDEVVRSLERIASYGKGEKGVKFLLEYLEKERNDEDAKIPRLTWIMFRFDI